MHDSLTTACGTPSLLNIPRWLRQHVAVLPSTPLRGLANSALPPRPNPPPAPTSSRLALLDALAPELVDWGVSALTSRAVQAAEGLVPGISLPHTAYQTLSAVNAAVRGDLLRALQCLPVTALAPAVVLDQLRQHLHALLPTGWDRLPDQRDVVMAVACTAVLRELARQGASASTSALTDVCRCALRQLRAGCNVMAGVTRIANLPAPLEAPAVLAGPPAASAPPSNTTAIAFPFATAQMQAGLPDTANASSASAWPLQGTSAATKPRPPGMPGVSGSKPKTPVHATRHRHGKQGFQIRRPLRRGGDVGRRARGNALNRGRHRPDHEPGGNADTRFQLAPGPQSAPKESLMNAGSKSNVKKPRKAAAWDPDKAKSVSRTHDDASANAARPASQTSLLGVLPQAPSAKNATLPSCVRFHDLGEALRQTRKARFDALPIHFCVHEKALGVFDQIFAALYIKPGTRGETILPAYIREDVSDGARDVPIRKYTGMGQLQRSEQRQTTTLDEDELIAVMTISVLPDHRLRQVAMSGERILAPNSFKLVQHTQLGGENRTFIAYFINTVDAGASGIKPGFLEINVGHRQLSVTDPETGLVFSSDTLDDFVAGLEQVSGCRFLPDADASPVASTHERGDVPIIPFVNLFVRDEAARTAQPPHIRQLVNTTLGFFSPTYHSSLDGLHGTPLFRTCFAIFDDSVVFVDRQGQPGTLELSAVEPHTHLHTLARHDGVEAQFIQDHGLIQGQQYELEEIADILENYGMHRLPFADETPPAPVPRLDAFHVGADAVAFGKELLYPPADPPLPTTTPDDIPLETVLSSTFRLLDNQLFYVEHDGTEGVLRFESASAAGPRSLSTADVNDVQALAFARRIGIVEGLYYAPEEVAWRLNGNGYVRLTD